MITFPHFAIWNPINTTSHAVFLFLISSLLLIPKSRITMLNSSLCLTVYGLTYSYFDKSIKKTLDYSCPFMFLVFLQRACVPPQLCILCLLPFDLFFLTLTRSRCRLTTASESRLRHYRWVVLSQWPAWCIHSFDSSTTLLAVVVVQPVSAPQ